MKIDNKVLFILLLVLIFVKIIEVSILGYAINGTIGLTVSLIPEGSTCSSNTQCDSGYCCHNICRLSCPYCGDQYCDHPIEAYENCSEDCIVEEIEIVSFIEKDKQKTIKIQNENLKVKEIRISVKNDIVNASIITKEITTLPILIPPETSYKHLEFITENIEDEDIDKVNIRFNIEKTWIADNNIDSNTIILQRYTDSWNKLPTSKIAELDTYITYEAESPGFSYFTITGEKKVEAVVEEELAVEPAPSSIIIPQGMIKRKPEIITIEGITIESPSIILLQGEFDEKGFPKPGTIYINLDLMHSPSITIYTIEKIKPENYPSLPKDLIPLAAYEINISGGLNHLCMNYQGYTDDAIIYRFGSPFEECSEIYKSNNTVCANITSTSYMIAGYMFEKPEKIEKEEPKDTSDWLSELMIFIIIILLIIAYNYYKEYISYKNGLTTSVKKK